MTAIPGVEIEAHHNQLDIRLSCLNHTPDRFVLTGGLVLFVVAVGGSLTLATHLLSIGGSLVLMVAGMMTARAAKTTHLRVTPDSIVVRSASGKQVSHLKNIIEICPEPSTGNWHKLTAITDTGKSVTVIDHLSEHRAQYVAQVMQNFLEA